MKHRIYTFTIISIMAVLILIPGVSMVAGKGDIYVINENRNKKDFPEFHLSQFTDTEYWSSVSAAFNDHFGCRDLLIRCKNQINYSVFKYSPELYFGENGYFSYTNVVANEQIKNEEMNDWQWKSLIMQLEKLKENLSSQGIALVIMIPPQKNTAFPWIGENYPVKRPSPNAYERFCQMVQESSLQDNYVDLLSVLEEAQKTAPVFHRTDFHWNDWGGAAAFEAAMDKFGFRGGMKNELVFSDLPVEDMGQAMSVPKLIPVKEQTVTVNKAEPISSILTPLDEEPFSFCFKNSAEQGIGALVVIGDSYSGYGILPYNSTNAGICDYFDELYFVHWSNSENLLNNLPENTRFIIIESIESALPRLEGMLKKLYNEDIMEV